MCLRDVLTSLVGDLEGTLVGRSVICGSSVAVGSADVGTSVAGLPCGTGD